MIRRLKDQTLSRGLLLLFNTRFKPVGEILRLELDSGEKRIDMEILLRGEREPIRVQVLHYSIRQEGERFLLGAEKIATSREWINHLIETYPGEKSVEIPERYAKILKRIV
jgi:hypothetical protein